MRHTNNLVKTTFVLGCLTCIPASMQIPAISNFTGEPCTDLSDPQSSLQVAVETPPTFSMLDSSDDEDIPPVGDVAVVTAAYTHPATQQTLEFLGLPLPGSTIKHEESDTSVHFLKRSPLGRSVKDGKLDIDFIEAKAKNYERTPSFDFSTQPHLSEQERGNLMEDKERKYNDKYSKWIQRVIAAKGRKLADIDVVINEYEYEAMMKEEPSEGGSRAQHLKAWKEFYNEVEKQRDNSIRRAGAALRTPPRERRQKSERPGGNRRNFSRPFYKDDALSQAKKLKGINSEKEEIILGKETLASAAVGGTRQLTETGTSNMDSIKVD